MKYLFTLFALACLLLMGSIEAKSNPSFDMGVNIFYSSLSSYGEWVDVDFGRAWRPLHVGYGWRPYMHGRWMWTDYGWYWVSQEPFGWATFHYGRWTYDDYYGWIWIPDDVWGPAWVEWRYNDDYIGWAPLSPYAHFNMSIGITIVNRWITPVHYWNFVPCRNFSAVHVNEYVQPMERSRRIFGSTRGNLKIEHEGERIINRGVDVNFIERRGNIRVSRANVVGTEERVGERIIKDSGRERVEVYRPRNDGQMRGGDRKIEQERKEEGRSSNDMHNLQRGENRSGERKRDEIPPAYRNQERRPDQNQERPRFDYKRFEQRRPSSEPSGFRERMQQKERPPDLPGSINREAPRGGIRQREPVRPPAPRPEEPRRNGRRP
jgi:hypothetical protein